MLNTATRWLIKLTFLPPLVVIYVCLLALSAIWGATALLAVVVIGGTAIVINLAFTLLNSVLECILKYIKENLQ